MSHPPSSLLERRSPMPMVCPLVKLGRTSPPTADQGYHTALETQPCHPNDEYGFPAELDFYPDRQRYLDIYSQIKNHRESSLEQSRFSGRNYEFFENRIESLSLSDSYERKQNGGCYYQQEKLDLSSLSINDDYWEQGPKSDRDDRDALFHEYPYSGPLVKHASPCYPDDFGNFCKSSPNVDQGYHTLVSPGPGPSGSWNDSANVFKGKKVCLKNNSFDKLPDDLVLRIFGWLHGYDLSVCARVCRRFEALAWRPMLWRTVTLCGERISGDKAVRGMLRHLCGQGRTGACPNIERVYLGDGTKITDRGLMLLARRCPELTHIQLHGCTAVTNQALFELVTRCGNLQHLDVTGCTNISCICLTPGPEPPRRLLLQYLDLTDCPAIEDNGLRIIVRNCPQLIYLYLRRCIQITDAGLKYVPSFCSGLRELSVSDCSKITDFGLYELAKLGATLRYLSVAKCDQVSDAGLKVIAHRCYKLRYLNVRGCEAVSDDAITILARSCTRLRALDIGKCDVSDAGLRALAESCPNIKKLSLRNCDLVTDRGIQCIAYYCRGLQQLNIQDCQISLEGYRAVKKYCRRCIIEHTNPGFF